ncbi:MAG TPA: DUF4097 family beta strand repeat-containing protein [Pyrinomonadaceae bacterium]|nr:DUF4097 family beta strand repeat-containing protein [Pyrinomonadaceae bacterium]
MFISIVRAIALPSLTVGLLTVCVFGHGNARDRDRRAQQVERTAPADAHVNVSACTLSGNFTVRGWDRNEVRVRVTDGADIELTRIDEKPSQPATELKLTVRARHAGHGSSCLTSADIEMDVPRAGGVKITTTNGDISVNGIGQLKAVTTSGTITIDNVRGETRATTIGGDLTVRNSSGSFKLTSTGGSIDARELKPLEAADSVSVTTVSGEVRLTHVQHQSVIMKSVSGEAIYAGALVHNGDYNLQNLSGEVRLLIPANSSFRLSATLGETVRVITDFNLKDAANQSLTRGGYSGPPRRVSATVGTGDASIHALLMNGSLRISKQ